MDLKKILQELREEHTQLEESILALERLAASKGPRRGRPPKWMLEAKTADVPKKAGRPPGTKKRAPKPE